MPDCGPTAAVCDQPPSSAHGGVGRPHHIVAVVAAAAVIRQFPASQAACTIGDDEIRDRIDLVERLRRSVTAVERTDHGLLLHFPARPDVDVRWFAVDEYRCCRFWGFAVDIGDAELRLRWDGPAAVGDLLDELADYFRGEQPTTTVAALL